VKKLKLKKTEVQKLEEIQSQGFSRRSLWIIAVVNVSVLFPVSLFLLLLL